MHPIVEKKKHYNTNANRSNRQNHPGGELNSGLLRDRQAYKPVYYRKIKSKNRYFSLQLQPSSELTLKNEKNLVLQLERSTPKLKKKFRLLFNETCYNKDILLIYTHINLKISMQQMKTHKIIILYFQLTASPSQKRHQVDDFFVCI